MYYTKQVVEVCGIPYPEYGIIQDPEDVEQDDNTTAIEQQPESKQESEKTKAKPSDEW